MLGSSAITVPVPESKRRARGVIQGPVPRLWGREALRKLSHEHIKKSFLDSATYFHTVSVGRNAIKNLPSVTH